MVRHLSLPATFRPDFITLSLKYTWGTALATDFYHMLARAMLSTHPHLQPQCRDCR
jgi:hypothetical protein